MAWTYALEARLLTAGPERTRALAMTLYLDPRAKVVESLSAPRDLQLGQMCPKSADYEDVVLHK